MDEFRLLHLADVHLGGSGPAFGVRVAEHQRRLQDSLARCVEAALHHRVHAVCIAGDLFDSSRPAERTLQAALRELRRLGEATPPIPCVILPGTHDSTGERGVYQRPDLRAPHLHVLGAEGPQTWRLPDKAAAFHGSPQPPGRLEHKPLQGLKPDPEAGVNVALAHGSMLDGRTEADSALITPAELAACGMDYVALGHWHDHSRQQAGGVTAAYSGSPEIVLIGQKAAQALLVTFRQGAPSVEPVSSGSLRCEALTLDPEVCPDEAAVGAAIEARADGDLILDVALSGIAPEGFSCDVARLQEELEGRFFRLRLRDQSVPPLTELERHGVARQLIAGRVVTLFEERLAAAQATGDEAAERLSQRALQLSVALLQGRDVLG